MVFVHTAAVRLEIVEILEKVMDSAMTPLVTLPEVARLLDTTCVQVEGCSLSISYPHAGPHKIITTYTLFSYS